MEGGVTVANEHADRRPPEVRPSWDISARNVTQTEAWLSCVLAGQAAQRHAGQAMAAMEPGSYGWQYEAARQRLGYAMICKGLHRRRVWGE